MVAAEIGYSEGFRIMVVAFGKIGSHRFLKSSKEVNLLMKSIGV